MLTIRTPSGEGGERIFQGRGINLGKEVYVWRGHYLWIWRGDDRYGGGIDGE